METIELNGKSYKIEELTEQQQAVIHAMSAGGMKVAEMTNTINLLIYATQTLLKNLEHDMKEEENGNLE